MTNTNYIKPNLGLTLIESAEKRRRRAEIVWLNAQGRDLVPKIEAKLAEATTTPRQAADLKLEIAKIAWDAAQLKHESANLKADLAEDRERFPR